MNTKVEVKEISSIERELSVVIPANFVAKEIDKAYQKLSQKVSLKGFRKGKVPRGVLEQFYQQNAESEALDRLLNESFTQAVQEHNLSPVSEPKIEATSSLDAKNSFSYTAKIQIRPVVCVGKWKGLAFTAPVYQLSDSDVDAEIEGIRKQHATLVPVADRNTIESGDLVTCQIFGEVEGEKVNELCAENQLIEVGSGKFLPEIEKTLLGAKVDEALETEAQLERLNPEKFKDKVGHLRIVPKSIKIRRLPELDDEFAKDLSDKFETMADVRHHFQTMLEREQTRKNHDARQDGAINALIQANPFEVPSAMVDSQARRMVANMFGHLQRKEATSFFQKYGAQLINEMRPKALQSVQASLLLEAIVEEAKLEATEEEILAELQDESTRRKVSAAELKRSLSADSLDDVKHRVVTQKAIEQIIASAKVTEEKRGLRDKQ